MIYKSCGGNNMGNMHFRDIDDTNECIVRKIKLKHGQEKFIETVAKQVYATVFLGIISLNPFL